MQLKVYSVFDSAVGSYGHPMNFLTRGQALRWFGDEVQNPNSQFAKHPKDFTLFELGEYDDTTGVTTNYEAKVALGTGLELQSRAGSGLSVAPVESISKTAVN